MLIGAECEYLNGFGNMSECKTECVCVSVCVHTDLILLYSASSINQFNALCIT